MARSRLFVAWRVPEPAASALYEFGARVRESLESAGGRGRWVDVAALHATVHFLGDVEDALVHALSSALATATSAHGAFEVTFVGAGRFPERGKPRVVFAAIGGGAPDFVRVADSVQRALESRGAPKPDKPFHPHVTLGRVTQPPRGRWPGGTQPSIAITARVGSLRLYRSELGSGGAVHTVIAEAPLG